MSWHEAADGGGSAGDAVAHGQDDVASDDVGATVERLLPGRRVQAQARGVLHWTGTVEAVAVPLGVVWIREDGLGERKLLDLREFQIRLEDPTDG